MTTLYLYDPMAASAPAIQERRSRSVRSTCSFCEHSHSDRSMGTRSRSTSPSCRTACCVWSRDRSIPALERLLNKGWVTVKWAETPTKRQARYYTITRSGRKQLDDKVSDYDRVALAIARVMGRA